MSSERPDDRDGAVETIVRRCAAAGLDLCARGTRAHYDGSVTAEHRIDAPAGFQGLLVVGNSAALWPHFTAWLRASPARAVLEHPVDTYAAAVVDDAVARAGWPAETTWIHLRARPVLSAARLCTATGLAAESPARLAAHPTLGPWFSLRAAVVLEGPGWEPPLPVRDGVAPPPCGGCSAPCKAALTQVLAGADGLPGADDVAERWRQWVRVRDACPVGVAHRYDDAQLRYHYTGDRQVLQRIIA